MTTSDQWTAYYWRHHQRHSEPHGTLQAAVAFLREGEHAERLLADSISGPDGTEIVSFRDLDDTVVDYAESLRGETARH